MKTDKSQAAEQPQKAPAEPQPAAEEKALSYLEQRRAERLAQHQAKQQEKK